MGPSLNLRVILVGILGFITAAILAPATSSGSEIVHFKGYSVGTIVVKTSERRLYYVLDENKAILETLTAIKRAGADLIATYFAKEAVQLLED